MQDTHIEQTHKLLFPASGDKDLCFQIYYRWHVLYQIVASLVVYVFTSKSEVCAFLNQAVCSVCSVYDTRWSLLPKKMSAKTFNCTTAFRFCNGKTETISIYSMRQNIFFFLFKYVLPVFPPKREILWYYTIFLNYICSVP